ncbi:MAG: hypothetical protein QM831_16610 [Kofleriaceae bacterium]
MSPLAQKIYRQLRKQLSRKDPSITYGELADAIESHPRSRAMHSALTEVTQACRHSKLPALPAIVWKSGATHPSTGYYAAAHPRAQTDEAKQTAWERELQSVIDQRDDFPVTLGE